MSESERKPDQEYPAVTIGVVTHDKRVNAFRKLLSALKQAIAHYPGECEVLIGNNGGKSAHDTVQRAMDEASIAHVCPFQVLDSPENNISIGRNLIIDSAKHSLLAFVDDDEYMGTAWLQQLVDTMRHYDCQVVAAPTEAVYPDGTLFWVKDMDIHNILGKSTGDTITYAGSGNVLICMNTIGVQRFNEEYGRTGGGDTEFFMRLADRGADMRWCSDARAFEDIPADKATWRYTLRRCMNQGANYRRIHTALGRVNSQALMSVRAAAVFAVSSLVSIPLLAVRHKSAGNWLKRAFSNLGKISGPIGFLYP